VTRYRKKPVVVDAIQWTGSNVAELSTWAANVDHQGKKRRGERLSINVELPIDVVSLGDGRFDLEIRTLEGVIKATHGDWIICGVNGEFYPCKPDIFAKSYEAQP
jgi:hypothetical protein